MLVKTAEAKNKNKRSLKNSEIVNFCFKCKFKSNNETIFESHVNYVPLIGPDTKKLFEKNISKSHKDLLYSRLANDSEDDVFSMDKSASSESGVEELDLGKEPVEHVASEESVEPIKPVKPENEVRRGSDIFNNCCLNSPEAGSSHKFQSIGSSTLGTHIG